MKNAKVLTLITSATLGCWMLLNALACKKETCEYTTPCVESCKLFEDFEDDALGTSGNWQTLDATATVQAHGGSNTLYLLDASGGSNAYNNVDFPKNLIQAGCALNYDVEYEAGSSNGVTASGSLQIYQGTNPATATSRAVFVLNSASLIVSGAAATQISVPLELASGTSLPSNAFGTWVLATGSGSTIPTAADIAEFNTLIQNIDGVNFAVDNGGNPAEQWWYDNFCFQQCCQ